MKIAIISESEIIALTLKEQLVECFQMEASEAAYRDMDSEVGFIPKTEDFMTTLASENPEGILLHCLSPQDPAVKSLAEWASAHASVKPMVVVSDTISDEDYSAYLGAGVHEIIDLKNLTLRSLRRAVLSADNRARREHATGNHKREILANQLAAEQASSEKTFFLSMVTHEIRSPLQNITGFSSLLEETEMDDEQQEYVSYINKNSALLTELVGDILDHSKIDRGTITLKLEPISLNETIRDAVSFVETRALAKHISIQTKSFCDLPKWVMGDKLRTIQILKNLLDNAIKFTPDGGSINVECDWEGLENTPCDGVFKCSVSDTGCGINPERAKFIFTPFMQGDPARDQNFGGIGLGLALCKRLCEMMRGKIWVDSTSEAGSTLSFKLTLTEIRKEPEQEKFEASNMSPKEEEETNILVVEDDANSRAYIQRFLRYSGLKCDIAKDGAEAVKQYAPGRHSLVITDIFMPNVSGFKVCEKIREIEAQNPDGKPCTIFAISAGAGGDMHNRLREAGADHYLRKPIRIDQMRQMIRDALPKK